MIVDGKIQENLQPDGRPVEKGWISSTMATARDPFNGKDFSPGCGYRQQAGSPVCGGFRSGYGSQTKIGLRVSHRDKSCRWTGYKGMPGNSDIC